MKVFIFSLSLSDFSVGQCGNQVSCQIVVALSMLAENQYTEPHIKKLRKQNLTFVI